jgi:hypothetical protein
MELIIAVLLSEVEGTAEWSRCAWDFERCSAICPEAEVLRVFVDFEVISGAQVHVLVNDCG